MPLTPDVLDDLESAHSKAGFLLKPVLARAIEEIVILRKFREAVLVDQRRARDSHDPT